MDESVVSTPDIEMSEKPAIETTETVVQENGVHNDASDGAAEKLNEARILEKSSVSRPTNPSDLWVETKTEEGKSYFYHALSRETTWTRPEGPNVKIMNQTDVEALMVKNQQQQQQNQHQQQQQQQLNMAERAEEATQAAADEKPDAVPPGIQGVDSTTNLATPTQEQNKAHDPSIPSFQQMSHPQQMQQQYYGAQYGMPPSGYGGYPNGAWGMPWQQHQQPQVEQPAKNLIVKPGVIEPQVIARAAEWSEHRAPDGRAYYYHAGRGESVWVKPQAIRDLEAARMAAHAGISPMPPVQLPAGPIMTAMQINATPVITSPQIHKIQPHTQSIMFDPEAFTVNRPEIKMDESFEAMMENKRKLEAEQKKKDDEEKAKQADKSRPISTTPIEGTPWSVVWTGDGRVFFYNPSTRTSVWERPIELQDRSDVDTAINTMPEQLAHLMPPKEDDIVEMAVDETAEDIVAQTALRRRTDSESSDHETVTPNKKPKLETVVTVIPTTKQPEKKVDVGKDAAVQAEIRAARERALLPLDTRVDTFVELLKEKDVSAFSTWEKELHKIVFDQRYLLLTSRERKQCFEKYVKVRAEEEHREMRKKLRQKRDDFRTLLEAANLHGKSLFSDFCTKYGKDDRFTAVEKKRERENHFNGYIVEVRRKEKEAKQLKTEQVRKDFIALLREQSDVDRHCRWSDVKKKVSSDSRYRAVDSSVQREDFFLEYCKILKDEKKKNKEKDRERKDRKENEKKDKDRHRDKDSKAKGDKDKDKSATKDKNVDREKDKEKSKGGDKERDRSSKDDKDKTNRDRDRSEKDRDRSDKDRGKDKYRESKDSGRSKDKKRDRNNEKSSKDSERSKNRKRDKDDQQDKAADAKPENGRHDELKEKSSTTDLVEVKPCDDKSQKEESTNEVFQATEDVPEVSQSAKDVPLVEESTVEISEQHRHVAEIFTEDQPIVSSSHSPSEDGSNTPVQESSNDTPFQAVSDDMQFEQNLADVAHTTFEGNNDIQQFEINEKLSPNEHQMDEQNDDPDSDSSSSSDRAAESDDSSSS